MKNNKKGFTLAEMLITIMIMLMVSAIVAAGVPTAKNAYDKTVIYANAQVLLSTAFSAIRNEMGASQDILVKDATGSESEEGISIEYKNRKTETLSRILKGEKGIQLQRHISTDLIKNKESEAEDLVADHDLYVTYDTVSYTDGVICFNNLEVRKKSDDRVMAKRDRFSVRILSLG